MSEWADAYVSSFLGLMNEAKNWNKKPQLLNVDSLMAEECRCWCAVQNAENTNHNWLHTPDMSPHYLLMRFEVGADYDFQTIYIIREHAWKLYSITTLLLNKNYSYKRSQYTVYAIVHTCRTLNILFESFRHQFFCWIFRCVVYLCSGDFLGLFFKETFTVVKWAQM